MKLDRQPVRIMNEYILLSVPVFLYRTAAVFLRGLPDIINPECQITQACIFRFHGTRRMSGINKNLKLRSAMFQQNHGIR